MKGETMKDFALMLAQTDPEAPAKPVNETSEKNESSSKQDADPGKQPGKEGEDKGFFDSPMFPIMLILIVVYIFMMRGPKKRQQQHKQMLDNLKKNDRIRTVGGIIGTVVDVRDDNNVVIKVDESNNTKMKIVRSAVGHVYTEDESQDEK